MSDSTPPCEASPDAPPHQTPPNSTRPGWRRRLLRGCCGLILALLLALAVAYAWITEPIDTSPLLGTPVAERSEALLTTAAEEARARGLERGALKVGWASVEITPPLGTPTYGYGARLGKGVERIADPVWAHALALSVGDHPPVVFVTADLCLWTDDLSSRVIAATDGLLPRERIYFGATHDHSGPGGYADGPAAAFAMGDRQPEIVAMLAENTARAIRDAVADRSPGAYRELTAPASEFVENRRRRGTPLDDELLLAEFRKADGRTCAMVSFSAHATAIGHRPLICSGDYPGALCRGLLEAGYDSALFLAAGTGQAGPAYRGETVYSADVNRAWTMGEALAAFVAGLSKEQGDVPFADETSVGVLRSEVALPPWRFKGLGRMLDPDVASYLIGNDRPLAHVHALRLGDSVYLGHSFEFSSVIARRLKQRARDRGGRLFVTSFNGVHNLYVVPADEYSTGYEDGMTLFGPGLGPYMESISEQVYDAAQGIGMDGEARFELSAR